jgi:hydrogenase nickel incorporation protein HypA/HybF
LSAVHELSIALAIVESLARHPAVAAGGRIVGVAVRVGALSGVEPEALRFAWGPATTGTPAAGSRLDVERMGLAAWCPACRAEREPARFPRLACPVCGGPTPEVLRGRELEILSMEVAES